MSEDEEFDVVVGGEGRRFIGRRETVIKSRSMGKGNVIIEEISADSKKQIKNRGKAPVKLQFIFLHLICV